MDIKSAAGRAGKDAKSVTAGFGKNVIVVVNLKARIKPAEEGGYIAACDALKIYSQGETFKEAKENIKEAADLFVDSCVRRGALSDALRRRGISRLLSRRGTAQRGGDLKKRGRIIEFPLELPLAV